MQDDRNLATEIVAAMKKQGVPAADVFVTRSDSFRTSVQNGKIDDLQRSTAKGMGIRIFKNGSTANTFTTDFSDKAIRNLARTTIEIIRVSDADKDNGLPPKGFLGTHPGELLIFDPKAASVSDEKKIEIARSAESSGLQIDRRIESAGAMWNDSENLVTLANSDGFTGQYKATNFRLYVSLFAEENGVKHHDRWLTVSRFFNGLDSPQSVGANAAKRVVAKIGGRKIKSQIAPVVLPPDIANDFLSAMAIAVYGPNIYRRSSFLVNKIGQKVTSPLVTILDDSTLSRGLASRPFDGEGVRSSATKIVESGILRNYLCDAYSARRLNLNLTGSASRNYQSVPTVGTTNFFIQNGTSTPKDIVGSVKKGLYLTDVSGSFNRLTGDFSQSGAGIWIENGELAYPVREITVAGNVLKLMENVQAVGNDLTFGLANIISPTLLISEITIGGL